MFPTNLLFKRSHYTVIHQCAEFGTHHPSNVKVSSKLEEGGKFKLIDLDATIIINPDDCQKRQVIIQYGWSEIFKILLEAQRTQTIKLSYPFHILPLGGATCFSCN